MKENGLNINEYYSDVSKISQNLQSDLDNKIMKNKSPCTNKIKDTLYQTGQDKEKQNKNIEHSKEDIKLLYKSLGEQCVYSKQFGNFFGFFASSFKNYKSVNEDKIRITINHPISQMQNNADNTNSYVEEKLHFFGLYDGHSGDYTSKYLKSNFHLKLFQDTQKFISNPLTYITSTFSTIESSLLNESKSNFKKDKPFNKSGSCAIILISFQNKIYIANCGNSRSIISQNLCQIVSQLSNDHIPSRQSEKNRIEYYGGKVNMVGGNEDNQFRIFPGGMRFSRSIGDFSLKTPELGGIQGVYSASPDIIEIKALDDMDFIIIASEGIIDKISNQEIAYITLCSFQEGIINELNFEDMLTIAGENIIKEAIDTGTKNNLSVIVLGMNNFYQCYNERDLQKIKNAIMELKLSTNKMNELYRKWENFKEGENESFFNSVNKEKIKKSLKDLSFDNDDKDKNGTLRKKRKNGCFSFCFCYK